MGSVGFGDLFGCFVPVELYWSSSVVVLVYVNVNISLKYYSLYSFNMILIKIGMYMYYHSANALQKCGRIRLFTPAGLVRGFYSGKLD